MWLHDKISETSNAWAGTAVPRGQLIKLPRGVTEVREKIRITSGVHLEGDGDSTQIHWLGDGPMVEFHRDKWGGCHDWSLRGFTAWCPNDNTTGSFMASERYEGFPLPQHTPGKPDMNSVLLQDLVISNFPAGGIDTVGVMPLNNVFERIKFLNHGGPLINLHGGGTNHIRHINREGNNRKQQGADFALITADGGANHIFGCLLEGIAGEAPCAYRIGGHGSTFRSNYQEFQACTGGIAFDFFGEVVMIDMLHQVGEHTKARFRNGCCAMIDLLYANHNDVAKCLVVEKGAAVHAGLRVSQADAKNATLGGRVSSGKGMVTGKLG